MRIWKLALSLALILLPASAMAYMVNSMGIPAQNPITVGAGVTKVVDCVKGRAQWMICPETVSIRCMVGTPAPACGAPAVAPSAVAGFLVVAGSCWIGEAPISSSGISPTMQPVLSAAVYCYSVGGNTGVDTFEVP